MFSQKKAFGVICLLAGLLLAGCTTTDQMWAVTTATIEPFYSDEVGDGYVITYEAPKSTAINANGELIKGPIDQYVSGIDKPVKAQKVQIRYQIDEPIFFEFLAEPATKTK